MAMIPEIDRTLHEPARQIILLYLISVKHADFTFLKQQTGLTQGNLSSHLSKLESAGFISIQKTFKQKRPLTIIELSDLGRDAFTVYIKNMFAYFGELNALIK